MRAGLPLRSRRAGPLGKIRAAANDPAKLWVEQLQLHVAECAIFARMSTSHQYLLQVDQAGYRCVSQQSNVTTPVFVFGPLRLGAPKKLARELRDQRLSKPD